MSEVGSYIKDETLLELKGRFKFVLKPLDEHLKEIKDPSSPPLASVYTPEEKAGLDVYGVDGGEVQIILAHAFKMSLENEMVASKVRELLQVAKLCNDGTLGRDIRKHRDRLEQRRQNAINADKKYGQTIKSNAAKRANLTKSWEQVEGQVRTRWRRILRGLSAALSRYEFFADLHKRDKDVLNYLATYYGDSVVIEGGRVTKFDWEMLIYMDISSIHHIVDSLLNGRVVNRLRL